MKPEAAIHRCAVHSAIASKESRGYFASPIGYVVDRDVHLLFVVGFFYTVGLSCFMQQSMQAPQMGGGPMNVNQHADPPALPATRR